MAPEFRAGRMAEVDKGVRAQWAQSTMVGQFLVCKGAHATEDAGTFEVYGDEDQAKARATELSQDPSSATPAHCVRTLSDIPLERVKKLTTGHEQLRDGVAMLGSLDGAKLTNVTFPLVENGVFIKMLTADAIVKHSLGAGGERFAIEFEHEGMTKSIEVDKGFAEQGSASPGGQPVPVELSVPLIGQRAIVVLKALPAAAALSGAHEVCARELLEVLIKSSLVPDGALDADKPSDLPAIAVSAVALRAAIESRPPTFAYPTEAAALGAVLQGAGPSMPPPKNPAPPKPPGAIINLIQGAGANLDDIPSTHAMVLKLAPLAKTQEDWDEFLFKSIDLTCSEKLKDFTRGSSNAMTGALNRWLGKRYKPELDFSEFGAKSSLDKISLMGILAQLAGEEETTDTSTDKNPSGGSSSSTLSGPKVWSEFSSFNGAGSSTAEEHREMLTLRGDYEKLHGDGGKGLKQLEQLEQLRETKDPAGLYKGVQECEHESLKRLLTTPAGEIGKALSGAYSQSTVNGIINIRHALDKRVESYVYGDKEPVTPAQTSAVQKIRTGNLSSLKWLTVIGKPDSGTADDPLKELAKRGDDACGGDLSAALAKASVIAQAAMPGEAAQISLFFLKLDEQIREFRAAHAEWSAISSWLSSVLKRATKTARQYSFGDVSSGAVSFDVDIIEENTKYREVISAHISKQVALKAAKSAGASSSSGVSKSDLQKQEQRLKELLKKAVKNKRGRVQPEDLDDDNDDEASSSTKGKKGNKQPKKKPTPAEKAAEKGDRPDAGSDEMKTWNENNQVKGKPRCWNDGNGGCSRGKNCRFAHVEE